MEAASRKAIENKMHLREVLSTNAEISSRLTAAELDNLFDPHNYTGMAAQFIDRAIAASKAGTR
jgi:3-carboxy-cis,cis-muconate cycloisomerase